MTKKEAIEAVSGAAVVWAVLPEDPSTAGRVHRAFQHEAWRDRGPRERAVLCGGFLLFAPVMLGMATYFVVKLGRRVRRDTGKGHARQLVEQLRLALTRAIPPYWYYLFEFYEDEKRARAMEYLYRAETKNGIYGFLRKHLSCEETTLALSNKAVFSTRCREHGAAAVEALATVKAGRLERLDGGDGGALPRCDLFFKPLSGSGGRGAERWSLREEGAWENHTGQVLAEAQLWDHLMEISREVKYVVRRSVTNHPDLADLSPGALSTVRVLTCLDENGAPEILYAVLRMASRTGGVVDNFHAGGIAARVDVHSGELSHATDMGLSHDSRWWDAHPETGARIGGRKLPMWDGVRDVARKVHLAFPDQVVIGWDVAILADGPALVEGNKSPDLDIIQRTHEGPIGNSRLAELLLFHIARAREARDGS